MNLSFTERVTKLFFSHGAIFSFFLSFFRSTCLEIIGNFLAPPLTLLKFHILLKKEIKIINKIKIHKLDNLSAESIFGPHLRSCSFYFKPKMPKTHTKHTQ